MMLSLPFRHIIPIMLLTAIHVSVTPDEALKVDDAYREWFQKAYHGNPEYRKLYLARKHRQLKEYISTWREIVLQHYSNGEMICECCGVIHSDCGIVS
jgi:hypothetical protein